MNRKKKKKFVHQQKLLLSNTVHLSQDFTFKTNETSLPNLVHCSDADCNNDCNDSGVIIRKRNIVSCY